MKRNEAVESSLESLEIVSLTHVINPYRGRSQSTENSQSNSPSTGIKNGSSLPSWSTGSLNSKEPFAFAPDQTGQSTPPMQPNDGQNNYEIKIESSIVKVVNAKKSYGKGIHKKVVLDNLCLTVPKGSIYGLLGASGCGKTTLLSCIVGRKNLDHGRLSVFGGVPGDRRTGIPGKRVGYMPQELALYIEFTIKEMLEYFGRIYGMDRHKIREKIDFLVQFLDLPHCDRVIRTLSGGQQRRVSFAVSLLHDPELLILDEPTVGVDPMLRQSIWNHLIRLAKDEGKTIIITTHYIEEARQASMVGLMRNGHLLAEAPPSTLLEQFNLPSLEDVFLKLCVKHEMVDAHDIPAKSTAGSMSLSGTLRKLPLVSDLTLTNTAKRQKRGGSLVYPGSTAMAEDYSIQAISYMKAPEETEFQKIKRRLSMKKKPNSGSSDQVSPGCCQMTVPSPQLLFLFLLPAVQVIFFCVAIGQDPTELKFAVVNHEVSNMTSNCTVTTGCDFTTISCRLLESIFNNSSTLIMVPFETDELAREAVAKGEVWGMAVFPETFTKYFLKRLWSSLDVDNETLIQSSIQVNLDMSNQQVAFQLQKALHEGYQSFFRQLLTDCEFPPEMGDLPLVFKDPVYGDLHPNFTEFMAPGIIILIIFFLALSLTGDIFVTERRDGLLDRSWIAGVLPSEILISHVFTQFLVLAGQTAITLVFIFLVFHIKCEGPVGWIVGLTLLQGTAGMCYGLFLSTIFNDVAATIQFSIGSFYPCLLLSGILWPLEGMPWYLRTVAWYLPCTAACQAMRDVMSRGWGITHPSVYLGYVSTLSWISVFIILSWIVIKVKSS
ncbi:hypothetical protein TCAL_02660 [Tigriopus californicus]|uniref:Uncharacterized protein n=1 Tax=Tigriopus californicus TaxID=6832 RepID=A0A553PFV2_TIGCA|nr:hypothetical protein TCAL_02660 [Tigriopus californicus]